LPDNGSSASYISPFLAAEAFAHKYKISAMVKPGLDCFGFEYSYLEA